MSDQFNPTPEDLARDLNADLALCEAATPGPWFWDIYCRVKSIPLSRRAAEWDRENFPDGLDIDTLTDEDWRRLAEEEPNTVVYRVPTVAGDTATVQGGRDAQFAVAAQAGWPAAIRRALAAEAEIERLRAEVARYGRWVDLRPCPDCGEVWPHWHTSSHLRCAPCRGKRAAEANA